MYANDPRRAGRQLGNVRPRGLAGAPAGAAGDVVTVGGDVLVSPEGGYAIKADDTGSVWHVLDGAATGWNGAQPPVTRGVVRGVASGPYTIAQVQAASTYRAGERGSTTIQSPQQSAAAAAAAQNEMTRPRTTAELDSMIDTAVTRGGVWGQQWHSAVVARMAERIAAGTLSRADADRVLKLYADYWNPANMIWLPPGGGDVPITFQGAVTDTGTIHPDALTPEAQARTAEILAYTAKMQGTTYAQEAEKQAARLRALNPGETFTGVEKFIEGMKNATLVQLTPDDATNTHPTVDERSDADKAADPYGVGAGSVYYDLAPAGTPGKMTGGAVAGPVLQAAMGGKLTLPLLLAGGLALLLVPERKGSSSRRRRS